MSLLRHAPRLHPADAERLARELYGLEGPASALPSERDQNFRLDTPHGRFVLKLANATEARGLLEAQNAAMEQCARAGARCPQPVAGLDGRTILDGPGGHFVRVLTWIPGSLLGTVRDQPPPLLEDLGRALGEIDRALHTFDHPAVHRAFHWDLVHASTAAAARLPLVDDHEWRALLEAELARIEMRLQPAFARLRRSVIHNDANDYNVVVADAGSPPAGQRVAGVIDFGDLVHSVTVAEAAVTMAYAVLDKPDPLAAAAHVLKGYSSAFPLEPDEIAVAFDLMKLRLCLSACLAPSQQAERPDDEYLGISQAPIRRTLPVLSAIEEGFAQEVFRRACGVGPAPAVHAQSRSSAAVLRRTHIGRNVRLSYRHPVEIVRGSMQYLFDAGGRRFLDAYNNVPHVGHCHPRVVEAAAAQMRTLNTNTRYLHDSLGRFAERLAATLPDPLSVCYFVNSGSEANELALRLARAHTDARDVIVLDHAYHGNTTTLVEMSPYKFAGPGGAGRPEWVHVARLPDVFRGEFRGAEAAHRYAADVMETVERMRGASRRPAAFIAETCPSVAGQIVLPPGYLGAAYAAVREAGGLCIADEVQTAYGRMGTSFYAFEDQRVVPDIVVLGKPIGNGHPLGAVVTTRAIAESFDNGMEYFSTFGGNTVSCAVGLAVLEVVQSEELQAHAAEVGTVLLERLRALMHRYPVIGDVRGSGLFLGVELVTDPDSRAPATAAADRVVNRLREEGILIGTEGPSHNVLKVRPPMPFSLEDAEALIETLGTVLGDEQENWRTN